MACESTCVDCYKDWISCGAYSSTILFNTGLDPGNYNVILTDKFDHKYSIGVVVDGAGEFEINTVDLPEGLFNEFGGAIFLAMFKDDCDQIPIPILQGYDYIDTDCIEITVKAANFTKMAIGCPV